MDSTSHVVSAPGKVLLTGGYLVLDRNYSGLVFALNARIHVHIEDLHTTDGVTLSEIIVRSPQFKDAVWEYGFRLLDSEGGISITELRASSSHEISRNVFIETTLSYVLSYISTHSSSNIRSASITILADNDYYSCPAQETPQTHPQSPNRFFDFGVPLNKAHKTGLGSSAALVTALTAALLVHFLPQQSFSFSTDQAKTVVHNLGQAAHCAAQGKVGSGFDVASAVYGSCLYRRFSPTILASCSELGLPGSAQKLKAIVEDTDPLQKWDAEIVKLQVTLPQGLRLVMCDVDCGSKTPGMVKSVLAWRKENRASADQIWTQLQEHNDALRQELLRLDDQEGCGYSQLTKIISDIRSLVRKMSAQSHVPIEPPAQQRLIDSCSQVQGVVGGVVPGAGGFDAIALLVEDKTEVLKRLREFLDHWQPHDGNSDNSSVSRVKLLGVREEKEGIRAEQVNDYRDWITFTNNSERNRNFGT